MINNFNFPEGVKWSLNYVSGPDFFSDDFKFSTAEKLFYYYTGSIIKYLDISNSTSTRNMFYGCGNLITIPQLNTSNVTNISYMFQGCSKLASIPLLDCSKVTSASSIFNPSYYGDHIYLTDLGGFKNLKVDLDIQKAPNLTVQSIMNVINNLYDFRANGESTTRTLQLGTTNLNKLTDEQKAVATNKGWSLT